MMPEEITSTSPPGLSSTESFVVKKETVQIYFIVALSFWEYGENAPYSEMDTTMTDVALPFVLRG